MRHVCVFFVRVNDAREWRERSSLPKLPIVYVCVCVCLCMFVYVCNILMLYLRSAIHSLGA